VIELSRPTLQAIRDAAERIAPWVHRTPVATSATFDSELGARIFFKCENLQKVGAFKARGATNAVLRLDDETARRGVITHSCAEIVFCRQNERQGVCDRVRNERGSTLIHPFENPDVVAGQGTAALELIEDVGELDLVLAPVGGGGLLAGTTVSTRGLLPGTTVWGAEPEAVDDAYRSLQTGVRQPAVSPPVSWADGLLTRLGELAFGVLVDHDVEIVTVSEDAILDATRSIIERMKLVVEPSAATVLAVLRRRSGDLRGKRVGAILSGGNTDFRWLNA
jgi:threonine dehydratase